VEDVTLEELESRPPNSEHDRIWAQMRMEKIEAEIRDHKRDIYGESIMVQDRNGKMLISVMATRKTAAQTTVSNTTSALCYSNLKDTYKFHKLKGKAPYTYRSESTLNAQRSTEDKSERIYDGIPPHSIEYISVHTQSYIGIHGVHQGVSDVRHDRRGTNGARFSRKHYTGEDNEKFLFTSTVTPQQKTAISNQGRHQTIKQLREAATIESNCAETNENELRWYWENVGVKHVDRMWPEQGKEGLIPALSRSKELFHGGCYRVGSATRFCTHVNQYAQELLLPAVLATIPQEYAAYRRTFLAASLDENEERRPGFHTGHVVVWKSVVHQHQDGGDSGICVIFCTGSFIGGYLVFPDLDLVFRYRPGDVIIFRSKALYHGVTTWVPTGDINQFGITPGRVAHVLYTKISAVEQAKDRLPGWARTTNMGREPDIVRDKVPEDFPEEGGPLGVLRAKALNSIQENRVTQMIRLHHRVMDRLDGLDRQATVRPRVKRQRVR
jgi:hypothetical protein